MTAKGEREAQMLKDVRKVQGSLAEHNMPNHVIVEAIMMLNYWWDKHTTCPKCFGKVSHPGHYGGGRGKRADGLDGVVVTATVMCEKCKSVFGNHVWLDPQTAKDML